MTLLRKLATEKEVSGSSQSVGTTTAAVEWARFKPRATAAAAAARLHTTGRRPYLGGWSVPSLRPLAGEAFALRPHQPREGGTRAAASGGSFIECLAEKKEKCTTAGQFCGRPCLLACRHCRRSGLGCDAPALFPNAAPWARCRASTVSVLNRLLVLLQMSAAAAIRYRGARCCSHRDAAVALFIWPPP
ncbi:hypothetical protein MRX96_010626 [Rhipicephalus microplus]